MKKQLIMVFAGLALARCGDSSDGKAEAELLNSNVDTTQSVKISREILDDMMQTLPSPIETANLITRSKGGFNKNLLIPSGNASNFPDKYSQALALGGYGVDLGYLNLNNKLLYVVEYLECVHSVSKDLKVNQFLDFSTMTQMAKNKNNVDSLIQLSTKNFNQIDEYLRSQNRGDLSVLILIGSWIEGLHMFSHIAKENPSEEINKRIGEQKIIIDNIYAILGKIERIDYYKQLKTKLGKLKEVYSHVKISYEYREPEMQEINGELVVTDKSETVITMTPENLETISVEIKRLRASLFMIAE
jgi:hypothetical protein